MLDKDVPKFSFWGIFFIMLTLNNHAICWCFIFLFVTEEFSLPAFVCLTALTAAKQ